MPAKVRLVFHTKEVMHSIGQTASQRMLEAVNVVRNQALETLSGNRTGRTYKVPGTGRTYTASAPGEPPAQASGELRQSVKVAVVAEEKRLIGLAGSDSKHAAPLEFGTRNMAARPWLRISFEKVLPKIKEILSRRWFR